MTPSALVGARDRLAALTCARLVLAASALGAPALVDAPHEGIAVATGLYVVVVVAAEIMRRRAHAAATLAMPAFLAGDGVYVVAVMIASGGPSGPLGPAVYLLIAAAAVVGGPRAGVGTALWSAFVLAAARAGKDLGFWTTPGHATHDQVALAAVSYAVVALTIGGVVAVRQGGLRRGSERFTAMTALEEAFERSDHDEGIAVALADHARGALGFRRAAVAVRSHDSWRGAIATGGEDVMFARDAPLGDTATATIEHRTVNLVRALDPGLLEEVLPQASNVVVVPLVGERGARGVVAAEWGGGARERVPAETVRSLETAASQAGRALDRRARLDEAAQLATRDALTGLANRRLFEETLELESARARREGTPLSLVVIDVDRFKLVNDSAGHRAGDNVLRDVGKALVSITKAHDLAARYGGDEFVVLLPGCPRAEVGNVADRVRAAVAAATSPQHVTVSAGVATCPDDAADGATLLAQADAALYAAKHAGRDQTARPPV